MFFNQELQPKQKTLGSDDLLSVYNLLDIYQCYNKEIQDKTYTPYVKEVAGKIDFTPDASLRV